MEFHPQFISKQENEDKLTTKWLNNFRAEKNLKKNLCTRCYIKNLA